MVSRWAGGNGLSTATTVKSMPCAGLPPLSALPERFAGTAAQQVARRLRFAPSVDGIVCGVPPLSSGDRLATSLCQGVCQSFCLSVQTAAISSPAPSAVFWCRKLSPDGVDSNPAICIEKWSQPGFRGLNSANDKSTGRAPPLRKTSLDDRSTVQSRASAGTRVLAGGGSCGADPHRLVVDNVASGGARPAGHTQCGLSIVEPHHTDQGAPAHPSGESAARSA